MGEDRVVQMFKNQINHLEQKRESIVAITHRHWLGVKYATQELFEHVIEIEELNSYNQVVEIGKSLLKHQVKKVLFSGFASGWNTLCTYLKEQNPSIKIIVFWHGNMTHMYETYSWARHYEIMELIKFGQIDQMAFAKASMCKVYENLGVDAVHLRNYVRRWGAFQKVSEQDSVNSTEPIRIGIYASGDVREKNAYTQIAAASLFQNATISMIPNTKEMITFAKMLNVKVATGSKQKNRGALQLEMSKNTINFYVTLTECAPLVPLESLNAGVLCLMGDNNHYFEDHELKEWLVISQVDNPEAIYNKAVEALKNKGKILNMYQQWYEMNVELVRESLEKI